jgi:nitrate reductase molybdenum cofactor assembly chaperone
MANVFKALSALLTYPTKELQEATGPISEMLDNEPAVPAGIRRQLHDLIEELATGDLYDLQERYVLLFDRTRSLSLHLFEHVHGESRDRGQAMVDLQNLYARGGLEISAAELPDFLPLFLEFLATQPKRGVRTARPAGAYPRRWPSACASVSPPMRRYSARWSALLHRSSRRMKKYPLAFVARSRSYLTSPRSTPPGRTSRPFRPGAADSCKDEIALACARRAGPRRGSTRRRVRARSSPLHLQVRSRETVMRDFINHAVFGWYPYLCLTVFLVGSLAALRPRAIHVAQRDRASLLRRRQLMWGSNLFHVGILVIFLGHFFGLLTPIWVFDALGISHTFKQWMAILGGVAGVACFIGMSLLIHRRLFDSRILKTSSFGDIAILLLFYAQLVLGMASIPCRSSISTATRW